MTTTRNRGWSLVLAGLVTLTLGTPVASRQAPLAEGRGAAHLEAAVPSEVGMSPERLQRLDAALQRLVDTGKLAGTGVPRRAALGATPR